MKLNLPVILLNGTILMPEAVIKLEFDDELSKSIIEESEFFHNKKLFVISKLNLEEKFLLKQFPRIGTVAEISRKLELPNGKIRVELKGVIRANVIEYLKPNKDTIESIVCTIQNIKIPENTKSAILHKLYNELDNYIKKIPHISNSILSTIHEVDDLGKVTDIIVNHMSLDNKRLLEYLMEPNLITRVEMILEDMYKEEEIFNIEESLDTKVRKELDKDQRNFYLREKIKLMQSELGEISKKDEEIIELKTRVANLNADQNIKDKILREINRYENMSNVSPELSIVKNYIDFMLELPWNNKTVDCENFNLVNESLNKNHFGLKEVKERIIEYLVVKRQSNLIDTPIICLVGPPGVGKTTLASSIALSMGRKFVKISVGGLDDEAIIKGHIRTYIGASPGKIVDGIRRAKSSNPVFLIDEIDKMQNNYRGDPASALLEVLDVNQNKYFKDNYIEEEYDLSQVLFITTANDISLIPPALKDRLEIININGYTEFDKIQICKDYLIPSICQKHGIKNIKIVDDVLLEIIRFYTRESGLRELERMLSKIVRKIVSDKILNNKKLTFTVSNVEKYLGGKKYQFDDWEQNIGVVNGLACTNYGADILKVECYYYDGNSNLIMTGSLGEMVLESAKIALGYIKCNYKKFNINFEVFKNDIHINIPNIDIKKDGPSAGVAITTSLISALTNLKISNEVAMTGEITLSGNVLKVGGLKEKIIGAYLNNIKLMFIPYANKGELDIVPQEVKDKITFVSVKKYNEIYEYLKER